MPLVLDDVRVIGRRGPLLELEHLDLDAGECVLMAGEPGHGHSALALTATGRLRPESGRIRLVADDGSERQVMAELRRVSAVVDLPEVSAPDDAMPVGTVTAEDLALARKGATPAAVTRWLERHALGQVRDHRVDALTGAVRTSLLTALAVERRGVRFLVLSLPDRHGGEPYGWWGIAQSYAALGYGVLVQCGRSSARDLGADIAPAREGTAARYTPEEALRVRPSIDVSSLGGPVSPPRDESEESHRLDLLGSGDQRQPPPPQESREDR